MKRSRRVEMDSFGDCACNYFNCFRKHVSMCLQVLQNEHLYQFQSLALKNKLIIIWLCTSIYTNKVPRRVYLRAWAPYGRVSSDDHRSLSRGRIPHPHPLKYPKDKSNLLSQSADVTRHHPPTPSHPSEQTHRLPPPTLGILSDGQAD